MIYRNKFSSLILAFRKKFEKINFTNLLRLSLRFTVANMVFWKIFHFEPVAVGRLVSTVGRMLSVKSVDLSDDAGQSQLNGQTLWNGQAPLSLKASHQLGQT